MPQDAQGAREATGGGNAAIHPPVDDSPFRIAPSTEDQFNMARLRLVPLACCRVDDIRFGFDSSFVSAAPSDPANPNDIRAELALLAKLVAEHPRSPLSVFGHADPIGKDGYNKLLSGRRAMAIYGLLIANGDPDTAVQLWQQIAAAEQWEETERRQMREFTDLPEDTADDDLIRAYLQNLCPTELTLTKSDFLAQGADPDGKGDYQGCGEFNPILVLSEKQLDENASNAPNRRVLVLMFRKNSRVDPAKWPCPRATEGPEGCAARFWSDGEDRRSRRLPDRERKFKLTKDTFACRFYHRLTDASPCEDSQGNWLFDPFAWVGPHGKDFANDQTFDLKSTTNPVLAFEEGEHLELGSSMIATVDEWAKAGLIDGGAMIDVKMQSNKISSPVDSWEIVLPDRSKPNSPYHAVSPMAKAHWHYIIPDPHFEVPAAGKRWAAASLREAIKQGNAAVLSFGQLVFVGGDWIKSFEELHAPNLYQVPVNVMKAVQADEALAKAIIDVTHDEKPGYTDLTTMLDAARTGKYKPRSTFEPMLAAFNALRSTPYGVTHLIAQFIASEKNPLPWSEIEKHATWITPSLLPQKARSLELRDRTIQILITNGGFLDLALYNQPHFSPTNWDYFEKGFLQALDELRQHLATPAPPPGTAPLPASVVARAAFSLHYVTDAFSAGHMRVPREALGTKGALLAKTMHDIDGQCGLLVGNDFNPMWRAYGDSFLHGPKDKEVLEVHKKFVDRAKQPDGLGFPANTSVNANYEYALAAVAEATLLVHYYAQGLRVNGLANGFPILDGCRGLAPINIFLGDNLAPTGEKFPPANSWLQQSAAEMAEYMRRHQPKPIDWEDYPLWPNPANNYPPFLDKNLNVDMSGTYSLKEPLGTHKVVVQLFSDYEIDFSSIFYIARVALELKTPMWGVPMDTMFLPTWWKLEPKPPEWRGHPQ